MKSRSHQKHVVVARERFLLHKFPGSLKGRQERSKFFAFNGSRKLRYLKPLRSLSHAGAIVNRSLLNYPKMPSN